jgi:hypothetical protein
VLDGEPTDSSRSPSSSSSSCREALMGQARAQYSRFHMVDSLVRRV